MLFLLWRHNGDKRLSCRLEANSLVHHRRKNFGVCSLDSGERGEECGRGGSGGGEREVALKSSRFIYIYTLVEKQVGSAGTEFRSQIPSADNIHGAELFISDF